MQSGKATSRYGASAQILHWLTVIFVAIAWGLGTFDDILPKGAARSAGLFVHISLGLAILGLLCVRIPWQITHKLPPERTKFGDWMTVWTDPAAKIAHYALYFLLAAVPITGIVLQFARGNALPLFGFGEIASPWVADRGFSSNIKEVHEIIAHSLVALASLHAVAALLHHFVFGDRTLIRMLPALNHRDDL